METFIIANVSSSNAISGEIWAVIAVISLVINTVSIIGNFILGYLLGKSESKKREYDFVETQISDILKLQLDHPDFRRPGFLQTLKSESPEALKYDAYCTLVWNSLETMYEKYGAERLLDSSFHPAMRVLAARHKDWLAADPEREKSYGKTFRAFLIE